MNTKTKEITLIGLMAAVTCIAGPLSLALPFSPVPISLTNLDLLFRLYSGNAARNNQLSCISAAGAGGASCIFCFHERPGEAFWTDRRISDRVYLYGADQPLLQ